MQVEWSFTYTNFISGCTHRDVFEPKGSVGTKNVEQIKTDHKQSRNLLAIWKTMFPNTKHGSKLNQEQFRTVIINWIW